MGLKIMEDIHAPTVVSGPTTQATTNGVAKPQTIQQLAAQKENLEAELSALGSVLDSVCLAHTNMLALADLNESMAST